jgi:transcriptional regulator with XRE-family HTH domain
MYRLEKLRLGLGISKSEIARRAGMQAPHVGLIISGRLKPYPIQLAKISKALGWSGDPEELMDEVD